MIRNLAKFSTIVVSQSVLTLAASVTAAFLISAVVFEAEAQNSSRADIAALLGQTDQELLTGQISENIPLMLLDEQHREFAKDMVEGGKKAAGYGEKILKGKSAEVGNEIGAKAADVTKEALVSQIEERFPEEDSPVRKLLSSVQNNDETYAKIAKAALNVDPNTAVAAIGEAMQRHAASEVDALVAEGKDYLQDVLNSLLPGSDKLSKVGVNAAETYVRGVEKFTEFVKSAKRGKDSIVLDCLHRRYQSVASVDGKQTARDVLESNGLNGFDCGTARRGDTPALSETNEEKSNKEFLRELSDLYRKGRERAENLTTETTTLAELGVDLKDVVDLIEQFEEAIRNGRILKTQARAGFNEWYQGQANNPARQRKKKPVKVGWWTKSGFGFPLGQLANWSDQEAATLKSVLDTLSDHLREFLGEKRIAELTGLPSEDFLPKDQVKTFTEGLKEEKETKKQQEEQKKRDTKDPEKVAKKVQQELKCDPKRQTVKSALDKEFKGQETADKGPGFVDEEGCRPYGPAKKVLQYEAPPKAKAQQDAGRAAEKVRCAALNSRVDAAVQQFGEGQIKQAGGALDVVLSDLAALSVPSACSDVHKRVTRNIPKVKAIIAILDDVKDALTTCDPDKLARQSEVLNGAQNIKLRALRNRIERSRPVAVKYTQAKASFLAGEMAQSESLFRQARGRARGTGQWTCENIEKRIGNNLRRINKLQELKEISTSAADACDRTGMSRLRARLQDSTNPFLDKLHDRLSKASKKCGPYVGNAKCQEVHAAWKKKASKGAFALGKDGSCGTSWGVKSLAEARKKALENCGKRTSGCKVIQEHASNKGDWTSNDICKRSLAGWQGQKGRGSFALAQNGACGWSYGYKTSSQARNRALQECRKRGPGCKIIRSR